MSFAFSAAARLPSAESAERGAAARPGPRPWVGGRGWGRGHVIRASCERGAVAGTLGVWGGGKRPAAASATAAAAPDVAAVIAAPAAPVPSAASASAPQSRARSPPPAGEPRWEPLGAQSLQPLPSALFTRIRHRPPLRLVASRCPSELAGSAPRGRIPAGLDPGGTWLEGAAVSGAQGRGGLAWGRGRLGLVDCGGAGEGCPTRGTLQPGWSLSLHSAPQPHPSSHLPLALLTPSCFSSVSVS